MSSVNLNADEATVLLGLVAGTLFLLYSFYRPQPLLHPILLGRQSDVGRVRNAGESAVYRNYGTGLMGRVSTLYLICSSDLSLVPRSATERRTSSPRPRQNRFRCP